MRSYTQAELEEQGFAERRIKGIYMSKSYPDGRAILFKTVEGLNEYFLHGARNTELKPFSLGYGVEELVNSAEDLAELEIILQGKLVPA